MSFWSVKKCCFCCCFHPGPLSLPVASSEVKTQKPFTVLSRKHERYLPRNSTILRDTEGVHEEPVTQAPNQLGGRCSKRDAAFQRLFTASTQEERKLETRERTRRPLVVVSQHDQCKTVKVSGYRRLPEPCLPLVAPDHFQGPFWLQEARILHTWENQTS